MARLTVTRRKVLTSIGATSTIGLAGCLGGSGGNGSGGNGSGGNGSGGNGSGGNGSGGNGSGGNDLPSEVVIGNVNPLSGAYASLGERQVNGMELVLNDVNSSDEILPDTELSMVSRDSGTDPDQGLEAARTLVEQENVDLLYGAALSPVTYNIMSYAAQIDIPHYVALSGDSAITGERCQRTTVRANSNTGQIAGTAAKFGANNLGNSAYILHLDDVAGRTIKSEATNAIESNGGSVAGSSAVPTGVSDWSPLIGSINSANPDWVMLGITVGVPDFLIAAGNRGLSIPISSSYLPSNQSGALTQAQFEALPELYRGGIRYTREIDNSVNQNFVSDYENQYDRPPVYGSEVGYMNAQLIAQSLERAGSLNTDAVIEGWRGLEFEPPRGPTTIRACDHQGMPPIYSAKVTGINEELSLGNQEIVKQHDPAPITPSCEESACSFN